MAFEKRSFSSTDLRVLFDDSKKQKTRSTTVERVFLYSGPISGSLITTRLLRLPQPHHRW